jgi:hypothetical protein
VADALPVLAREPQVSRQRLPVVEQGAGRHVGRHVEDRPVGGLDLGLSALGYLGQNVAGAVDQTPLAQRAGQLPFERADQPSGAVGDDQQRWA